MRRSNPSKRHSDDKKLRKYSEILLPRSMSHSFNRRHRDSSKCDENSCGAAQEDLFYSSSQPHSTSQEESDASIHGNHNQGREQLTDSARRSWQKLRNTLIVTSTALSLGTREKSTCASNDAFMDYFSTQKRPSLSSRYYRYDVNNNLPIEQTVQAHKNEESPYFEGADKLVEPQLLTENGLWTKGRSATLAFNPPVEDTRNEESSVEVQHAKSNGSPHITKAITMEGSKGSTQNVPLQLEEWGGIEEGVPPSGPGLKSSCSYNLRHFNFCPSMRTRFPKSRDSCCANPSEINNPLAHFNSTSFVCNPQGSFMFFWLGIVSLATEYNLWTSILRQAFREVQKGKTALWIGLDGVADIIYLLDIIVQFRTSYLEKGLVVRDSRKIATRYLWSRRFALDSLALLPFDLLQSVTGLQPLLRFPRFLKCFRAWHWKIMVENRTTFPNIWRVLTLTHILFLGCHWFASIYYILSESNHFQDPWGYPAPTTPELQSLLRKYLQSFYWATVTLTTIGDIAEPGMTFQYAFTITTYLLGVFVFATIVGQVGTIINNRNAARLSFESLLDNAKSYMSAHHVPQRLRNRVLRWYDYTWERRRLFGENDLNCLGNLPEKLKTELALHVHLETLKKVTIFHECRPEFLHDLVLKMRPYIFTPGDLICRKGEVAREMFIIADGVLEVIGTCRYLVIQHFSNGYLYLWPSKAGIVLKRLEAGDFFGEIGILCINGGGNKRTADVRAVGYAELFVLSREDVLSALADHPDAHAIIMEHATKRLLESKSREDTQVSSYQRPTYLAPSGITASKDVEGDSMLVPNEAHGPPGRIANLAGLVLPGARRPANTGIANFVTTGISTATSAISEAQEQTFALKKDIFMRREREALGSLADLNRFVEEAMFFLTYCSERIAARDERINELVAENTILVRKLKRLREARPEFRKDWDPGEMV